LSLVQDKEINKGLSVYIGEKIESRDYSLVALSVSYKYMF